MAWGLDDLGIRRCLAQAISRAALRRAAQALVDKFSHVRFEPSGMTKNPEIRFAKSIVDYIFRWMAAFLSNEAQHAGVNGRELTTTRTRRPSSRRCSPTALFAARQALPTIQKTLRRADPARS
jgi:ribonucleoside-diphosphate reductase alpha chain